MDDILIVKAMLEEHGIKCAINPRGGLDLIIGEPPHNHATILNSDATPTNEMCLKPDLADPNYIEKIRLFIETCKAHSCVECPRSKASDRYLVALLFALRDWKG